MLHIIWMIFKILCILLLSILILLFSIGLLLLLWPISYQMEGGLYGKPEGKGTVSWLCHLVSLKFSYVEEKAEYQVMILGRRLRRREEKEEKARRASRKRSRKAAVKKPQATVKTQKDSGAAGKEPEAPVRAVYKKTAVQEDAKQKDVKQEEENKRLPEVKQKVADQQESRNPSLWERFAKRVKSLLHMLSPQTWISGLEKWWKALWKRLRNLKQKKDGIIAFVRDVKNREAFFFAKDHVLRLLRHILPGKVTIKLHYGTGDPAMTGMITGAIFMLYPRNAKSFQLTPDFACEDMVLEGEVRLRGHAQLGRILWTIFRIYRHRECNRIIRMLWHQNLK